MHKRCIQNRPHNRKKRNWPVALAWNSDVDGRCVGLWRSTCFRFTAHPVTRFMVEDLWAGFTGALPSRKPGFTFHRPLFLLLFFFFIFFSFSFSPPPPPPPLIWSRQTRDEYSRTASIDDSTLDESVRKLLFKGQQLFWNRYRFFTTFAPCSRWLLRLFFFFFWDDDVRRVNIGNAINLRKL